MIMACRYNSYSSSLVRRYGYRIYRVGIDAGFTCPNRISGRGGCVYCDSLGARAAYQRKNESGFGHDSSFVSDIDSIASSGECSRKDLLVYDEQDIINQIERGISFQKSRYGAEHFAAYLQSFSNTFAPVDRLKKLYDFILSRYTWDGLIVSTRPDCLDDGKLGLLASYRKDGFEVCVELGLQSGSDTILRAMNRGHDVGCFIRAARRVRDFGLSLCMHILTGFPGEGKEELDRTIEVINAVRPDALKIHNLNVVAGTALYEAFLCGEVTAPCVSRHVGNVIYILRHIPSDIVIERLICETPNHRLASPRLFPDKNRFLGILDGEMERLGAKQGDLWQEH